MTEIEASSIVEAVQKTISLIDVEGETVSRRVGSWALQKENSFVRMKELQGHQITLTNPLARYHNLLTKGVLAETFDLLHGENPGIVHLFFPFYNQWRTRGGLYPYVYGARLHGWNEEVDQWSQAVKLLQHDPTTRHALLVIRRPLDIIENYQPCSQYAHFQIDSTGRLNLTWTMRSTDTDIGGASRNLFMCSHFLEQMCYETGLEMGKVKLYSSNIHIYETQYEKTMKLLEEFVSAPEPYTKSGLFKTRDMQTFSMIIQRRYTETEDTEYAISKIENRYFADWARYLLLSEPKFSFVSELSWLLNMKQKKGEE